MILFSCLAAAAFAVAAPAAAQPAAGDAETSAQDQARFDLLKKRFLQKQGIPISAATAIVPLPVPGGPPIVKPPSWAAQERERSKQFNLQFGPGSYEGIIGFSNRCVSADGCDKLATADVIGGAYKFVDLQKDVERKALVPDSPEYKSRHEEIKGGMRSAMEEFRPRPGARSGYDADFIKFSDPIVKKIFSKEEMLQYAERNATSSDSAPFYTYLGQALNGAGPPGKARAAFDAALQRDPKNQAALSGRAEAKLNQGDYPGAALDARAALKMDPGDGKALAALKFSEGRQPALYGGGSVGGARDAGGGAPGSPGAGASTVDAFSPGAGPRAAPGRLEPSLEFVSRSEALVADARRSLGLGDARAAVALLIKAVEINPRNAEALALTAMADIRLKNYPDALAAAEAGLKLAPGNAALLDAKANALNYMKDYRGALAAADLALSASPNDAMAHYNRAWALGGLHDREGSLASLRTAAELNPQFAPTLASALMLPLPSDILYLFPGEAPGAAPAAAAAPSGADRPSRTALWGALASGLLAVLLLAAARTRRSPARLPPPPAFSKKIPDLLGGKFEVGDEIGAGGMGVVYAGRDRSLDRAVAIKRMREEIRWDPKERARFVAEAKVVAKLRHPHIVEIHAIVEDDGEVYLIFEHIAGKTLHDVIERDKKLPFEKARDLFRGVASALDYAHAHGVIHRDLKPANLMVDGSGRVRVMDFGIARLTEEALSRHSRTTSAVGTPLYMAPEQEQGVARKESDAYSMAICLYEALTGRRPFEGMGVGLLMNKLNAAYEPPSKLNARSPAGLDEVFKKALDPDPDKRYSSAGNLARALEALESPRPA